MRILVVLSMLAGGCGADEPTTCGNGVLDPGEVCDDGNTTTERGCAYGTEICTACDATCAEILTLTGGTCGDGIIQADEECDDGDTCGRCTASCTEETGLVMPKPKLVVTAYTDAPYTPAGYDNDADPVSLDFGSMPKYTTMKRFFWLDNPTREVLVIESVAYDPAKTIGSAWYAPGIKSRVDSVASGSRPIAVPAEGQYVLEVTFESVASGSAEAEVVIVSNACNGGEIRAHVTATVL